MPRTLGLAVVVALASLTACSGGKDPLNPGTPLGTFHVDSKLTKDTCSGAPATWAFDVNLSKELGTIYWIQGGAPVSGVLDASAHVAMTATDTRKIHDADTRMGLGYCGLTRDDAVDMTLAADLASFSGALSYRFSPSDNSDCSDQLEAAGGTFTTLPCQLSYDITATRTALPKGK